MIRVAGPAVDVVRRHYGVDHLNESGGSMDFSSNSSLFHFGVRYDSVATGDVQIISNIRCLRLVGCMKDFTP